MRAVTTARVLLAYLLLRQITSALGLNALFGQAQMIRPLIAPMAEAAEERHGPIAESTRMEIRAYAAATDNIGLFFGEDVFVAIGSVLLMKGFLQQSGYGRTARSGRVGYSAGDIRVSHSRHQAAAPRSQAQARALGRAMITLEHVYILTGHVRSICSRSRARS
jgi:hypothetical protein